MAVGIVALALVSVVHASPILTLFNTGLDNNGVLLANGALDPHYKLTSAPSGPVTGVVAGTPIFNTGFPIPPWVGADGTSQWITPGDIGGTPDVRPAGTYIYSTTFDLTGYFQHTAVLTMRWAMDNTGVSVLLNGNVAPGITGTGFSAFSSDFTINSGFIAGLNTLDFVINNAVADGPSNPTGLRVEISGTVDAPEPGSFLLFGAGLVGLSMIPRRLGRAAKSK